MTPGKGPTALCSLSRCPTGWTESEGQSLSSDRSFTTRIKGSEAPPFQKHNRASTLAHSYWGDEKTEGSPIKCLSGTPRPGELGGTQAQEGVLVECGSSDFIRETVIESNPWAHLFISWFYCLLYPQWRVLQGQHGVREVEFGSRNDSSYFYKQWNTMAYTLRKQPLVLWKWMDAAVSLIKTEKTPVWTKYWDLEAVVSWGQEIASISQLPQTSSISTNEKKSF